jgi:DNA-binding PadR family transcriptional regulator
MEGADFLKLEELILLAIAGKSEIYGLEIASAIAKASKDKVQLNYGSLYPYLNRLEKKGYISSRWEEENERKGARRKYYQITDKGTKSLDEATLIRQRLRQPAERDVDELLKNLQHPKEKERIRAIDELKSAVKFHPELYFQIKQAFATFIRTNSPHNKQGEIESDRQEALDVVIGKQSIDLYGRVFPIDLAQTNLSGANLMGADLMGADLMGADLMGANLMGANLGRANLQDASFQNANLQDADLLKTNLEGANLAGANLQNARLMAVKNLAVKQLHSANNWEQVRFLSDYEDYRRY